MDQFNMKIGSEVPLKSKVNPNIPLAGSTFSFLGAGTGTFFSGAIFFGGSGTWERLRILV